MGGLIAMVLGTLLVGPLRSAEPSSGALRTAGDEVQWKGPEQDLRIGDVVGLEANEACGGETNECDVFVLDIAELAQPVAVTVTITGPPTDDYDLYVHRPDGSRVGDSASPGPDESVTFPVLTSGRYEVRVNPFTTTPGSAYEGTASMTARDVPPDVVEENIDPAPAGPFEKVTGFAIKTGFRAVFAWQAAEPVSGVVHIGTAPDALDVDVTPPGPPDTAQLAVADGLEPGAKYYWQVEDRLTGEKSGVGSFTAANAYTDWDGEQYTVNMLVQMQTTELPPGIPGDQALADLAQGMSVVAERIYDATDGFLRVGDIIVTDTVTDYVANVPFEPVPGCEQRQGNLADVLVETTPPMDSHTFGGFAISDPCTSFYVGRAGWLRVPSFPWRGDLDFGATSAHELSHYALAAPDLYPGSPQGDATGADCHNNAWDGSLMYNTTAWEGGRWWGTELDRSQTTTPCEMGTAPFSWDNLRERYLHVGSPVVPEHQVDILPRGNPDGGALRIHVLDRTPLASSLESFTPNDENTETLAGPCTPGAPLLLDEEGDAKILAEESDANLDLTEVSMSSDGAALTIASRFADVRGDGDLPSPASTGEALDVHFKIGDRALYARASRTLPNGAEFSLSQQGTDAAGTGDEVIADRLEGSFDADGDEVRIVVPAAALGGLTPGTTIADVQATVWRAEGVLLLGQDTGRGMCAFTVAPASAGDASVLAARAAQQEGPVRSGGTLPRTGASLLGLSLLGAVGVGLGRVIKRTSRVR